MEKSTRLSRKLPATELRSTLGDRLRQLLTQHNLSVTGLSTALSVSRQSCYKWLNQDTISDANLHRLAAYFDVTPHWLKFGTLDIRDSSNDCGLACNTRTCLIKREFIQTREYSELIWEFDLDKKTFTWYGTSSQTIVNVEPARLPVSLQDFLNWMEPDYREIFLVPLRRAIVHAEMAKVLIPLWPPGAKKPIWVNCQLYANCASKLIVGSFTTAKMQNAPSAVL